MNPQLKTSLLTAVFALTAILSVRASAVNIRVIGNAGDEVGMMALTRESIMKDYLRFCLRPENECGLIDVQRDAVHDVLSRWKPRNAGEIIPDELLAEGLDANSAMFLEMMADTLGRPEGAPRYPPHWRNLAHLLFNKTKFSATSLYLPHSSLRLRVFQMRGEFERGFFYVENESAKTWENLNPLIIAQLDCRESEAQILSVGSPRLEGTADSKFTTRIRWRCGDFELSGNLVARPQEIAGVESWLIMLYGRESKFITPACASGLKGSHK